MPPGGTWRARRQGAGGGPRQRGERGPPSSKKEEAGGPSGKQDHVEDRDRQQQPPAVYTPEKSNPVLAPHHAASSNMPSNPDKEKQEIREGDGVNADNLLIDRVMEDASPPVHQRPSPAPTDTETAAGGDSPEARTSLSGHLTHTDGANSTQAAAAAAAADTPSALAGGHTQENRSAHSRGDSASGERTPEAQPSPASFDHQPDTSIEASFAQFSSVPEIDSHSITNSSSSSMSNSTSMSSSSSMSNSTSMSSSSSVSSSSRTMIRPLTGPGGYDASKDVIKPPVIAERQALFSESHLSSPSAFMPMATRRLWLLVFSVLLTWVQDPLLSLLASAAAARMQQGASLAVVAVGAGGQVPDGMSLLLVALGSAVGALCSRLGPCPTACNQKGRAPINAAAVPAAAATAAGPIERQQARSLTAALRVAAVGAWLAGIVFRLQFQVYVGVSVCLPGLGVVVSASLYVGSETILSFFLTIKGNPSPPAAAAAAAGAAAAAAAAAAADRHAQEIALSLASRFLQLRCLSLPCCIVALTAKAALLTFRDFTPQLVTLAAAAVAAPLLFMFSARAAAAASPAAAAASFAHAAACTVSTVQALATLLLLLRLGVLAAAATEQQQQQQQRRQHGGFEWLQQLRAVCWLYRPPLFNEVKAFAPFVIPVLTQCCVR
ncbi:hypothetical protein Emag_006744 [Eimeria magna]